MKTNVTALVPAFVILLFFPITAEVVSCVTISFHWDIES